jgi:hypothetical protein
MKKVFYMLNPAADPVCRCACHTPGMTVVHIAACCNSAKYAPTADPIDLADVPGSGAFVWKTLVENKRLRTTVAEHAEEIARKTASAKSNHEGWADALRHLDAERAARETAEELLGFARSQARTAEAEIKRLQAVITEVSRVRDRKISKISKLRVRAKRREAAFTEHLSSLLNENQALKQEIARLRGSLGSK